MSETILKRTPPTADARLPYGPTLQQFGDLRLPSTEGPHPAVIAIHGGFWRNRYDLEHLGHLCAALTASGYATWSIEYRRVGDPDGGWPGTFSDVALAARFLFDNADRFDITPNRVVSLGHSAGGHLALWLAGMHRVPDGSPIQDIGVSLRGVASLAGVSNLDVAWHHGLSDHAVEALLGGRPAEVPERYSAASPARLLPLGIPQFLLHGDADDTVPHEMSESYAVSARTAGDPAERIILAGADHFDLIDPASSAWPVVEDAVRRLASPGG